MTVFVTDAAWVDMLAIVRTIAQENPRRAESFLEELYLSCEEIGGMPGAYPHLPDHMNAGIRRKVHGNYLMFYRAQNELVEILRVLHGARDYDPILFPDE